MNQNNSAIRIAFIYLVIGFLWILFSDRLLELLATDSSQMARISMFKGWAYVCLTSLLLYILIRRSIESQLKADHELYLNHETIEHSADEVIWTDESGNIIYANPATTAILGYSAEELRAMTVHDLGAEFPPEVWPDHWLELKKSGSLVFETVQRHKNGSLLDVEVSSNYIRHGDREYTAAFVRNISERKRSQAALLAAECHFRNMLETVDLTAVMLDSHCRITFCNDFLLTLTGWTLDEIIGKDWFSVFIPAEERSQVLAVNESIQAESIIPHFENHILGKNGERYLIAWNNTVLRAADGSVAGTASIGVDITEHRRLEREQRQMEQRMLHAQKLESLGIMAGGIAHDFNNILSAVLGNAELVTIRLNKGEPVEEFMERIKKSAGQAADLAGQMLDYSGRSFFRAHPVDLNILLEEMRPVLKASVSSTVELSFKTGLPVPFIQADALQIQQVITNLTVNSSESIGNACGTISIATGSMECERPYLMDGWPPDNQLSTGLYVYFDVTDSGCGMDKQTVDRMFDPFFTTKFIGRGLGMAAAMGIVKGHSGCIKVLSVPGEGTTIRVLFPASTLKAEAETAS